MIVVGAVVVAVLAVEFDTTLAADTLSRWPRLFGARADGARGMLEVIASAMMTVAGLTFSITVLVLSMAASQYTPRVIRTFMSSRSTQVVLGVFIGIFAYCLIVLRSIRGGTESFVPSTSVTLAIVLALIGVGVLVYFIHHIAESIQASTIIHSVATETLRAIDDTFPSLLTPSSTDSPESCVPAPHVRWHPVPSRCLGYLQTVDIRGLTSAATRHDTIIRMEAKVGDFIAEGQPLASATAPPNDELADELNRLFLIGRHRTVEQDVGVGIRQLVDIALRALSPALNDPATAAMCIDFLYAILARLASRRIIAEDCFDNGQLRVIMKGPDFRNFLEGAFEQIAENAGASTSTYLRLLATLKMLAEHTHDADRRRHIAVQVQLTADYANRRLHFSTNLARIEQHRRAALGACECYSS